MHRIGWGDPVEGTAGQRGEFAEMIARDNPGLPVMTGGAATLVGCDDAWSALSPAVPCP